MGHEHVPSSNNIDPKAGSDGKARSPKWLPSSCSLPGALTSLSPKATPAVAGPSRAGSGGEGRKPQPKILHPTCPEQGACGHPSQQHPPHQQQQKHHQQQQLAPQRGQVQSRVYRPLALSGPGLLESAAGPRQKPAGSDVTGVEQPGTGSASPSGAAPPPPERQRPGTSPTWRKPGLASSPKASRAGSQSPVACVDQASGVRSTKPCKGPGDHVRRESGHRSPRGQGGEGWFSPSAGTPTEGVRSPSPLSHHSCGAGTRGSFLPGPASRRGEDARSKHAPLHAREGGKGAHWRRKGESVATLQWLARGLRTGVASRVQQEAEEGGSEEDGEEEQLLEHALGHGPKSVPRKEILEPGEAAREASGGLMSELRGDLGNGRRKPAEKPAGPSSGVASEAVAAIAAASKQRAKAAAARAALTSSVADKAGSPATHAGAVSPWKAIPPPTLLHEGNTGGRKGAAGTPPASPPRFSPPLLSLFLAAHSTRPDLIRLEGGQRAAEEDVFPIHTVPAKEARHLSPLALRRSYLKKQNVSAPHTQEAPDRLESPHHHQQSSVQHVSLAMGAAQQERAERQGVASLQLRPGQHLSSQRPCLQKQLCQEEPASLAVPRESESGARPTQLPPSLKLSHFRLPELHPHPHPHKQQQHQLQEPGSLQAARLNAFLEDSQAAAQVPWDEESRGWAGEDAYSLSGDRLVLAQELVVPGEEGEEDLSRLGEDGDELWHKALARKRAKAPWQLRIREAGGIVAPSAESSAVQPSPAVQEPRHEEELAEEHVQAALEGNDAFRVEAWVATHFWGAEPGPLAQPPAPGAGTTALVAAAAGALSPAPASAAIAPPASAALGIPFAGAPVNPHLKLPGPEATVEDPSPSPRRHSVAPAAPPPAPPGPPAATRLQPTVPFVASEELTRNLTVSPKERARSPVRYSRSQSTGRRLDKAVQGDLAEEDGRAEDPYRRARQGRGMDAEGMLRIGEHPGAGCPAKGTKGRVSFQKNHWLGVLAHTSPLRIEPGERPPAALGTREKDTNTMMQLLPPAEEHHPQQPPQPQQPQQVLPGHGDADWQECMTGPLNFPLPGMSVLLKQRSVSPLVGKHAVAKGLFPRMAAATALPVDVGARPELGEGEGEPLPSDSKGKCRSDVPGGSPRGSTRPGFLLSPRSVRSSRRGTCLDGHDRGVLVPAAGSPHRKVGTLHRREQARDTEVEDSIKAGKQELRVSTIDKHVQQSQWKGEEPEFDIAVEGAHVVAVASPAEAGAGALPRALPKGAVIKPISKRWVFPFRSSSAAINAHSNNNNICHQPSSPGEDGVHAGQFPVPPLSQLLQLPDSRPPPPSPREYQSKSLAPRVAQSASRH